MKKRLIAALIGIALGVFLYGIAEHDNHTWAGEYKNNGVITKMIWDATNWGLADYHVQKGHIGISLVNQEDNPSCEYVSLNPADNDYLLRCNIKFSIGLVIYHTGGFYDFSLISIESIYYVPKEAK